ncbi:MAG: glutamate--tRNA ligase [Candidatus Obscuribacterales bacterium]|nr:glutamate--tRNA ligase [Candidatus Obscuribacterales bacterium]
MSNVRVRIAPSPTGTLHVGTARTALYNYLYAKKHGGTFIMRLEDTDEERSKEEHTQDILAGLKWLELTWDEGPDIGGPYAPYRQMEKIDHYDKVANQLIANGTAYFCYCTQDELAQLKEEQKASGKAARYDNRCRHLSEAKLTQYEKEGRIPAIRFRMDEPRIVSWHDGIKGGIEISSSDLGGDMVIVKSTGVATYNFAVVVDDIDMKMTHVIRGEDHIHNTAKQILLYEALGTTPPEFAHPALLFDEQRRKLSKRLHGEAVHIDNYRKLGYMPEAMINYLAQVSWSPAEGKEIFTLEEACKLFDLSRVSKSPAVFDVQRLNWFNSHYIRNLSLSTITDRAMPYLPLFEGSGYSRADLEKIVACVRDGLTTLSEITEATRFFFEPKVEISNELKDTVLSKEQSGKVLKQVLDSASKFPYADAPGCKALVDAIGKELGLKGKDLYWPIRTALSGKVQGPDLGSMISNLGEARVKARLEAALGFCQSKQAV